MTGGDAITNVAKCFQFGFVYLQYEEIVCEASCLGPLLEADLVAEFVLDLNLAGGLLIGLEDRDHFGRGRDLDCKFEQPLNEGGGCGVRG